MQYQLNTSQTDVLRDALDDVTGGEVWPEVIEYSGRGMNGQTCLGIVASDVDRLMVLVEDAIERIVSLLDGIEQWDAEELVEVLRTGGQIDTVGLNEVIYWPGVVSV
jgi:hypothetical protein